MRTLTLLSVGLVFAASVALAAWQPPAASPLSPPNNGPRRSDPTWHALVGATVHVKPGQTLESATVVIRGGRIESVRAGAAADGKVVPPPAPEGARVWDATGLHVYPGFIDAYVEVEAPRPDANQPGSHWSARVTPQRSALDGPGVDDRTGESLRKLGFAAAGISPRGGIFRGSAAVVSLGKPMDPRSADRPPVYRPFAYHSIAFDLQAIQPGTQVVDSPGQGRRRDETPDVQRWSGYPDSQMGAIALIRQTFIDADWQASSKSSGDTGSCLDAIAPGDSLHLFATNDELEAPRAAKVAREFRRRAAILGCGTEFARLEAIKRDGLPVIVPLNYPRTPDVSTIGKAESVDLRDLMTWEQAPTNARRLDAAGVKVSLTTAKLRDRAEFTANLRAALRHGLAPERALAMLTTQPAELLGVADKLGTIEAGKVANLIVSDGDLFVAWPKPDPEVEARAAEEPRDEAARAPGGRAPGGRAGGAAGGRGGDARGAKIRDLWIDGVRHEITPAPDKSAHGTWVVVDVDGKPVDKAAADAVRFVVGEGRVTYLRSGKRATARNVSIRGPRVSYTIDGKELFEIEAVLIDDATVIGDRMTGVTQMPSGRVHRWSAERESSSTEVPREERGPRPEARPEGGAGAERGGERPAEARAERREEGARQPARTADDEERERIAQVPEKLGHPFGPYMREALPKQPGTLVIRNATIWTCNAKNEVIENGVLVVQGGKIVAVGGAGLTPRVAGELVEVDAKGKHVAPGIIDCHSHTGISGGVNESGQAVTAEVRIGDVTDPDAISWYRQLASGVTAVNNLHGSANAIGGQNCVNKVRWGVASADEMHFEGAKPGIKFALGENPKQSNWGDRNTVRYPQTRMGVEALIRDRFTAAREYAGAKGKARRDLELEALAEILAGQRLVHAHSYRQDEILMLCRVAGDFGFKVGTFQHILEGYKVADELRVHALGASAFSDWWAYKVEVQDAIPQAGPIMHEQGVVVSFNSDSDELARRLNTEAAKAIKYGLPGFDPSEALKFVTLNPAKQLAIADRVGSLEPGKDADFAIWSASPLSAFARCEATYIDGRLMFSLEEDAAMRREIAKERHRLIQKALAVGRSEPGGGGRAEPGLGGPWQRPTEDGGSFDTSGRPGMLQRYYLQMLNRGQDPEAAQCGDCGLMHQ
ncbi:MAG: amidohydrolase family protein [Phycisphaerae bacterium]|nr:amidohydrolase family protein [Phycisphaerae bacterium]